MIRTDIERDETMTLTDLRRLCQTQPTKVMCVRASTLRDLHEEIIAKDEVIERLRSEAAKGRQQPDGATP